MSVAEFLEAERCRRLQIMYSLARLGSILPRRSHPKCGGASKEKYITK